MHEELLEPLLRKHNTDRSMTMGYQIALAWATEHSDIYFGDGESIMFLARLIDEALSAGDAVRSGANRSE